MAPGLAFAARLAVVSSASEVTASLVRALPSRYGMKGTHGSSMVLVVDGAHGKVLAYPGKEHMGKDMLEEPGQPRHFGELCLCALT